MRRAARAPSSVPSGGIRTSITARSGAVAATAASTPGASPARATTSCPASSSSRARPSRNSTESSPITMRTAGPPRRPSPSRRAAHAQRAPGGGHPVDQPGEPGAGSRRRAAPAVVAHPHPQPPVAARHVHADDLRVGVLDRVRHRLARHVVRRRREGVGQRIRADVELHGQRHRGREPAQRRAAARRRGCSGRSPCAICRSSATAVASSATAWSSTPFTSAPSRCRCASRSDIPSDTSRCWAPSCRSRSSRRRSA